MIRPAVHRVLILTPSSSYRVSDFLQAAARLKAEVVIGTDHTLVMQQFTADSLLRLDFGDPENAASQIVSSHDRKPFHALIGVDESTSLIAATAARMVALPHNSPQSIRAAHNKHAMRCALEDKDLDSPGFHLLRLNDDPKALSTRVKYPCVLKPLGLSASRGVIRVNQPAEFVVAAKRIRGILAQVGKLPLELRDSILTEDFIPGRELALEGLLTQGRLEALALFDKPDPLDGPYFEETLYVTPSRLAPEVQAAALEATRKACQALGLVTGPVHAELRVNETGPWLIELAARSIGGRCSRSLSFADGMSLEELIIRDALGLPATHAKPDYKASGVMMIPVPGAGILQAVHGMEAARCTSGVTELVIEPLLGERLVPLPEGDRYLGFIFARGHTPEAVEAALRCAHTKLRFELKESRSIVLWG
ncbi:MAG: ATP-grasp domain-containing protein [Gammaproteobacteria bacterium]